MISYIRNKPLPARRYLALLVLPWCVMLLLAVAVLWPYLARFRTTVEALQDVQLPVPSGRRWKTSCNGLSASSPRVNCSDRWKRPSPFPKRRIT